MLPDDRTLQTLIDLYESFDDCDLFYPVVRAPERREDLGASAWKPEYKLVDRQGESPVEVLPGHLVIANLDALRLELLYRLFHLGYQTRNRPLEYRKWYLLRGVLAELLLQDLRHVFFSAELSQLLRSEHMDVLHTKLLDHVADHTLFFREFGRNKDRGGIGFFDQEIAAFELLDVNCGLVVGCD